jgi:Mn2+/Fe2+ NRAMP family transporter
VQQAACEFLEGVKHQQHRCWVTFLLWWLAAIIFVFVISEFFNNAPVGVVQAVFYGSMIVLFVPVRSLYSLKCPYCRKSAGALPIFRYRFLYCKSCGERIECKR